MLLKRLLKYFFKSNDITFKSHLRVVATNPFEKFRTTVYECNKLKPNLCTTYIELCKHFGKRDRETNRNG